MIVIVQPAGQLGNRLILFAHLIAFAREHRLKLVNLAFEEYAPLFPATQADLFCRYPPTRSLLRPNPKRRHWLRRLGMRLLREAEAGRLPFVSACRLPDDTSFSLDTAFAKMARRRVVLVGGWLIRRPQGLTEEAPAVRDYFRPLPSVENKVKQTIQSARAGHDLLIGVHLRGGDYRNYAGGRYFYTTAQYASFLTQATALFAPRRPAFLLCSNEPQDAEAFARFSVTFGAGDLIEDLYALAACDYLIGPPSTFTVWASFYGSVPLCHVYDPATALTPESFHLRQPWGRLFGSEAV